MPNFKRERVNPYLFLLLVRMLEYEFCGIKRRPSKLEIGNSVELRFKQIIRAGSDSADVKAFLCEVAETLGSSIRTDLLTPQDFYFSEAKLDLLASQISVLGQFYTWEEFTLAYKDDRGAQKAEAFKQYAFSELPAETQVNIMTWVENRLVKLYMEYVRDDKANPHIIIRSTGDFVIRTIATNEIPELLKTLGEWDSGAVLKGASSLSAALGKNKNIIYIYKDDFDIIGCMAIYPVKDLSAIEADSFELILPNQLHSLDQKESVEYVLIPECFYENETVLRLLLYDFEAMISNVANPRSIKVIVPVSQYLIIPTLCSVNNIEVEIDIVRYVEALRKAPSIYEGHFMIDWNSRYMMQVPENIIKPIKYIFTKSEA